MERRFAARVAEAYGDHSEEYAPVLEPILGPMAKEMVGLGRMKAGDQVLDLATGTGLIAREAGQFTDSVTGTDLSLGILGTAQSLAAGKIPFVAGDAHRLPFQGQRFHVVTCGVSLSHFSDVSEALGEVLRVLRPGGRFITSAWGSEGESPAKEAAIEVRNKYLGDREVTFEGAFTEELWADVEQGSATLEQAGFVDVQVITRYLSGEYRNPSDAIEAALAWPLTRYRIAMLDREDQERLRQETAAAILALDDLHWQSEIHYYQATRPEH